MASERKCDVTRRSVTRNQLITVLNGAMSNISVPGLHDDVMGYAGGEGSHGPHTVYTYTIHIAGVALSWWVYAHTFTILQ